MPPSGPGTGASRCGTIASRRSTSALAPCLRTATVSTTGTPSSRSPAATPTWMPRRGAASTMCSATTLGLPSSRSSSAKRRCRRRLVASITHSSTSGAASPG
ncbi:hypothetical protein G6F62_014522 [Rhizopus arrhizus]|nr:hypothetical protein G6F62_014522 [Rhizopus arrhizus]